jgi:prepilin-type N-terminal cleavage/methylation domain-containing protein
VTPTPIRHGEAGFSLIELAVAASLTAILAAATLPAMSRYLRTHQLTGAVNAMAAELRFCRARAASEGNNVVFSWNADAGTYTVLDDDNNNGATDTGEAVLGPKDLPAGVTLTNGPSNAFVGTAIVFQPDGSANQGGQFTLTGYNELAWQIQLIRVSGLVKVLS